MPAMREGVSGSDRCVGKKPVHYLRIQWANRGVFTAQRVSLSPVSNTI